MSSKLFSKPEPLDTLIVGGGIGGIISLKYLKDADLSVKLLESRESVGGVWRDLPSWQDIQMRKEDWTLGDIPIEGESQTHILKNIFAWIEKFDLSSLIECNQEARQAHFEEDGWTVTTQNKTFVTKNLILASGGHSQAMIPEILRIDSKIQEFHSSAFADLDLISGKSVLVVGGGASAFDLLDLCLSHNAKKIYWVYRNLKWMIPTTKRKQVRTNIRKLAKRQMFGANIKDLNRETNEFLNQKYKFYGLESIKPDYPFDYEKMALIPGRPLMTQRLKEIERHPGEVEKINGNEVVLKDGTKFTADLLLWGTGYTVNLGYLGLSKLAGLKTVDQVSDRCGDGLVSLDYPNLFLFGIAGLDSTGAAPWAYSHSAKTLASHLSSKKPVLKKTPLGKRISHFDWVKFLAKRDRKNYGFFTWYFKYLRIAWRANKETNRSLPIP